MESLITHEGIAALLDINNIDTDQIIPKQFLKDVSRSGFGKNLFFDWRYLDDGSENPEFELNQPKFTGASILVAGDNFGCGSSREHAPWAIRDYGFRVVISTSFADIFYNNCFKNGILPVRVTPEELSAVMTEIQAAAGIIIHVDLQEQRVTTPGGLTIGFEVDGYRKESLIKGQDDIDATLQFESEIKAFESNQQERCPWLWQQRRQ